MTEATLSLQQVVERLGVHYMTVYRYVRLGRLPAVRDGRTWRIRAADLAAFTRGQETAVRRGSARWDLRFVNRLLAGDEPGAWGVVEAALSSGLSPQAVYTDMLIPALASIGRRWESGAIDVATEHVASRVATRVVSRLGPRMRSRGVRRGTIVLGSTQTELHALPLSLFADLLRAAHFDVVDLGVNLPAAQLARTAGALGDVVAVAIGVTTSGQDAGIAEAVSAVRAACDAPILVGGSGIDRDAALALGADAHARSGPEAVALVESLIEA